MIKMKKIFTGLFLLFIAFASAQENKNKFVVSANLSTYPNYNTISPGPFYLGYFLTDHFSLGGTGRFSTYKSTFSMEDRIDYHYLNKARSLDNSIGVFARYNFPQKNKFALFLLLTNSYHWFTFKRESISKSTGYEYIDISTGSSKGYAISLTPGIIYFIHQKFSTEIALGGISYSTERIKQPDQTTNNYSGINAALFTSGFNLGFSYYFGLKNKK